MSQRILVVEDDDVIATVIHDSLDLEGFQVKRAADGKEALAAAHDFDPNLIILDLTLPDTDGFTLCRELRAIRGTPIIILSARSEKADKLRGLMTGADDYITKPFDLEELIVRVKVVLRRRSPSVQSITMGSVTVDLTARRATDGNRVLNLTYREFELLRCLAESRGSVHRDELLRDVWGYREPFSNTRAVDNAIVRLRKKIEPDPQHPAFIHTVHGDGYYLVADAVDRADG